jgi:hypothetical protein
VNPVDLRNSELSFTRLLIYIKMVDISHLIDINKIIVRLVPVKEENYQEIVKILQMNNQNKIVAMKR